MLKRLKRAGNAILEGLALGLCLIMLAVIWAIDRILKRDDDT